ncbi:MAG: hypothetical protein WBZ36_12225 [Candidatus Nitrosopolaris sp.]
MIWTSPVYKFIFPYETADCDERTSNTGFFGSLNNRFGVRAPYILIECKNYGTEVANMELDQLSGRLKPKRGMFGILTYRKTNNERDLLTRCQKELDN